MRHQARVGRIRILEKYGIKRIKNYQELKLHRQLWKERLYRQQGGVCALSGESFSFEEMNFEHIVPWRLLKILGFDSLERWDEKNLVLVNQDINSAKGHRIYLKEKFAELFVDYWNASVELNEFEKDPNNRRSHSWRILKDYI